MQYLLKKYNLLFLFLIILLILVLGLYINQLAENHKKPLILGDRGNDIKEIQQRLVELNFYKGLTNGYYDLKTRKAVEEFQKKYKIPITGTVNQETWQEIINKTRQKEKSLPNSNDVKLLARVVEGEAADEPYTGKIAVAAVILNRIENPSFPNTLSGVIYQPGAFESVSNGQVNRPTSKDSLKASRAAFKGMDPTKGAIYFWNPAKPVNPWVWQRKIITTIGKHVFAI